MTGTPTVQSSQLDPEKERVSLWTILPGGTHGHIVTALGKDASVVSAVQNKIKQPNDLALRARCVDAIVRATGNCLGQILLHMPLNPADSSHSIYALLTPKTEDAIVGAVSLDRLTHDAFATGKADTIIQTLSRETGRCVFQAAAIEIPEFKADLLDPGKLLNILVNLLKAKVGV